jgi:nicotinamidase-related amidase
VTFTIPIQFYERHCVAWDDANPAKGFAGAVTRPLTLSSDNTVVGCMHPGNYCYPGGVEWGKDSRCAWWAKNSANLPRIRKIIDGRIAPFLTRARRAGIRVIYLLQGWACVTRYPQYREIAARVKEPVVDLPRSPNEEWRREFRTAMLGPEMFMGDPGRIHEVLDVAPSIAPQPQDWVIATTAQATTLLSENGISNILYTGFDTGGCVWLSAGGMRDMSKLGYRCILLRDCTTGGETAETYDHESLTKAVVSLLEMTYATADSGDVLRALEEHGQAGIPRGRP